MTLLGDIWRTLVQQSLRLFALLTRAEHPVLARYMRQRTPLARMSRHTLLIASLLLIGMIYGVAVVILPPSLMLVLAVPLVVLALLVIWVLPDLEAPPSGLMVRCLFIFIVIAIMWPNYLAVALPGLPWISLRRLILTVMCVLLLICLSTSSRFRQRLKQSLNGMPLLWKMVVAFVIVQTLSLFMSPNPVEAFKDYVNYQTIWTAVFFASAYAFCNEKNIMRFFVLVLILTLMIGIVGVLELLNKGVLWANHIPSFLQVDNLTGGILEGNWRRGRYRVVTTFSHPLAFAEYLALITPIVIHFILFSKSLRNRIIFIGFDIFIFFLILTPQSRLGFGCFLLAHLIYALFWAIRRWVVSRGSIFGPAITVGFPAILLVFSLAVVSVDALRIRALGSGDTAASDAGRAAQREAWLPALASSPPFGNGPRQGPSKLGTTYKGRPSIDNYYIWISLDYGIPGFLIYFGMIIITIFQMLRLGFFAKTPFEEFGTTIAAILLIYLMSKSVLSQEDSHWLPFLLMGLTTAMMSRSSLSVGPARAKSVVRPTAASLTWRKQS